MNKDITYLYDVLLDNQDKDIDQLIKALEDGIAALKPFNHSAETITKACNTSPETPDLSPLDAINLDTTSKRIEAIEKIFTKRQCCLMLVKLQTSLK